MAERLSVYDLRSKRRALAGDVFYSETKPNNKLKTTAEGIGRDVLIGVFGGGLASALLGKYSFIIGLGVAGFGHYSENKALSALGLGMMASGTFRALTGKTQDEKKPKSERIKERLEIFKEELKQKFFLDKVLSEKQPEQKTKEKATETKQEEPAVTNDANEEVISGFNPKTEKEKTFLKTEIDRIKKEVEEEAEKEFVEYQNNLKQKANQEVNYAIKSTNIDETRQKATKKDLEDELESMEQKDNLY